MRTASSPPALLSAKPAGGKLAPFSHHLSAFLDPSSALANVLPTFTLFFRAEWGLSQPRVLPRAVSALGTLAPAATLSLQPVTCHCGSSRLRKRWHRVSFLSRAARVNEEMKTRKSDLQPQHRQGSVLTQPTWSSAGLWEADSAPAARLARGWHGKPPGAGMGKWLLRLPEPGRFCKSHPCPCWHLAPSGATVTSCCPGPELAALLLPALLLSLSPPPLCLVLLPLSFFILFLPHSILI